MKYYGGSSYQKLIYYFFGLTCFERMSMRRTTTSTFKNNTLIFPYNYNNITNYKTVEAVERYIYSIE